VFKGNARGHVQSVDPGLTAPYILLTRRHLMRQPLGRIFHVSVMFGSGRRADIGERLHGE
jgi:hypothetical protein